jgi:AcrR family transcriptional regulator
LKKWELGVTRPSDITRERILKAAERLFADRGYEETSVRAIVAKARVNQAAINYHFGGKDGLYREVLRAAFRALTEHQLSHAQETKGMSREDALAEFIRHQFHPLAARDELSRHFRIFNWEAVRPTTEYRKLLSEEAAPFLGLAVDVVGRFMPDADRRTLIMAAIWLVGQCTIFIRNREQLANPPVSLELDERAVEQLTTLISGWALSGLSRGSGAAQPSRAVKKPQARGATFALGATEAGGTLES